MEVWQRQSESSKKTNHPRLSSKSPPVLLGYLLLIWHLNSYIRTQLHSRSQFSCPFSQQAPVIKKERFFFTNHTDLLRLQKITCTVLTWVLVCWQPWKSGSMLPKNKNKNLLPSFYSFKDSSLKCFGYPLRCFLLIRLLTLNVFTHVSP